MDERFPDPFAGQAAWAPRPPRAIVPVPATSAASLRGKRVITGLPGYGWRADLRADNTVVQGSRTYVPVMPEHEWYRAEAERIEVFAPLVPAERVWVEQYGEVAEEPGQGVAPRLVSLDTPPARPPIPVASTGSVTGRRVVRMIEGAEQRDLRAVTEAYTSTSGDICVRVAAELEWYRWAWSGQPPKTLEVPVHELWVE